MIPLGNYPFGYLGCMRNSPEGALCDTKFQNYQGVWPSCHPSTSVPVTIRQVMGLSGAPEKPFCRELQVRASQLHQCPTGKRVLELAFPLVACASTSSERFARSSHHHQRKQMSPLRQTSAPHCYMVAEVLQGALPCRSCAYSTHPPALCGCQAVQSSLPSCQSLVTHPPFQTPAVATHRFGVSLCLTKTPAKALTVRRCRIQQPSGCYTFFLPISLVSSCRLCDLLWFQCALMTFIPGVVPALCGGANSRPVSSISLSAAKFPVSSQQGHNPSIQTTCPTSYITCACEAQVVGEDLPQSLSVPRSVHTGWKSCRET